MATRSATLGDMSVNGAHETGTPPLPPEHLPDAVSARLAVQGHATIAEIHDLGHTNADVTRWVRAGHLMRLRRGLVTPAQSWHMARPWERHEIRARAVYHQIGTGRALSHHSALAVQGLRVHGVDDRVHLVPQPPAEAADPGRRIRRSQRDLVIHAPVARHLLTAHGGVAVVSARAAVVQVAAMFGVEAGLVAADSAAHDQLAQSDDLRLAIRELGLGRGAPAARLVAQLVDGRSESVGETRVRWLLYSMGVRQVTPQVEIRDREGNFVARVDLLVQGRLVVEYDGTVKYEGADGREALVREKRREDRIRALGFNVLRVTSRDLDHPADLQQQVLRALSRLN